MFSRILLKLEKEQTWMKEYNEERPHDALNNRTPWEYLVKFEQQENPNLYGTYSRKVYTFLKSGLLYTKPNAN